MRKLVRYRPVSGAIYPVWLPTHRQGQKSPQEARMGLYGAVCG